LIATGVVVKLGVLKAGEKQGRWVMRRVLPIIVIVLIALVAMVVLGNLSSHASEHASDNSQTKTPPVIHPNGTIAQVPYYKGYSGEGVIKGYDPERQVYRLRFCPEGAVVKGIFGTKECSTGKWMHEYLYVPR
jgi:hypothetical protein